MAGAGRVDEAAAAAKAARWRQRLLGMGACFNIPSTKRNLTPRGSKGSSLNGICLVKTDEYEQLLLWYVFKESEYFIWVPLPIPKGTYTYTGPIHIGTYTLTYAYTYTYMHTIKNLYPYRHLNLNR